MRSFHLGFLNAYFYYLVFGYIFGVYSLVGSGLLEFLMAQMEADREFIQSTRIYIHLLGIPLLVLSGYSLIRSISDLLSRRVHLAFTVSYFLVCIAILVLLLVQAVSYSSFAHGDFQQIANLHLWAFIGFNAFIYTLSWLLSLRKIPEILPHQKAFSRGFGIMHFLFMLLFIMPLILRGVHEVFIYIFLAFFLSWHLIPLLFMNIHLHKYHSNKSAVAPDFREQLSSFARKYEISKREKEVVQLICKGHSNQEISEALFISLQTVKDHVHRIFTKTGVKNRVQLTNLLNAE